MQSSPSITERLANMPIWAVLVTIVVLLLIRCVLLKQKTPVTKSIAEIAESLAVAMGLVFLIIRPFIIQAFFIPSESMVPTLLKDDHIMVNKFIYRFREPARGDVMVFRAPPEASDGVERDFIKRVIGIPGDEIRIEPGFVMVGDTEFKRPELRELLSEKSYTGTVRIVSSKAVLVDGHVVTPEEIAAVAQQPNDTVVIVPGRVFINGKPIKEPYLNEDADDRYPGDTMWPSDQRKYVREGKDGKLVVKIPKGRLLMLGDNRNNSKDARYWGLLDRRRVLGKAMFIFWPLGRIRWLH